MLANLCVSHIMSSQNEEAEDLMRRIEREEDRRMLAEPDKQCLHLCIVNLGILCVILVHKLFYFILMILM